MQLPEAPTQEYLYYIERPFTAKEDRNLNIMIATHLFNWKEIQSVNYLCVGVDSSGKDKRAGCWTRKDCIWDVIEANEWADKDGFCRIYFTIKERSRYWEVTCHRKLDTENGYTGYWYKIASAQQVGPAVCIAALMGCGMTGEEIKEGLQKDWKKNEK